MVRPVRARGGRRAHDTATVSPQGGSDVRANTTVATPVRAAARGAGAEYTLVGHKWFTSAPMSDAFLTLAQVAWFSNDVSHQGLVRNSGTVPVARI